MNARDQDHQRDNNTVLPKAPVVVTHLYKKFGGSAVLDNFHLTVRAKENVAVLGRSGAGKSVLIKCIIGLLKPDTGQIEVLGKNVPELNPDELDSVRSKIGFLFQNNALYDSMTVRQNLEFPLRRHWLDISQQEVNERVAEALENVGLGHTVDMMPQDLSGGMQKRVALARTLILKPEIILYDEPTTGLDPITGKEISTLIVEIQRKYNTSSIVISHDMHCIEITSDWVVVLMDGKCHAQGTYAELQDSTDEAVTNFFK